MITHQTIKHLFQSAVQNVTAHIRDYSLHPGKVFSRTRKFPADKLIRFLVAEGSSSTRVELFDFFGFDPDAPTSSAFRHRIDIAALLRKELIPIRGDREYPRLQTAHFRKPKYFAYRAV